MELARFAFASSIVAAAFAVISAQAPVPGQPPAPGQPVPAVPGAPPPRTPPRDVRPGEDPQKGTAILRGHVVAADSGNPLRRAMVRVMAQDGRSGGMTTTDAQGRFEVKELLAGRYAVTASKGGYVMMQYGQRRPDQQGTLLEVLNGQTVEKIVLSLPRGGVITGRVVDEFGDPLAGAQINALRFRYVNGGRRLQPAGGASTDDLGMFRMYGLAPGDYFVSGSIRSGMMAMPGVSTSTVEGYASTYFPGTPNANEAQRVTVKVAQETTNISFALTAARLARIAGRAVSSTGEPQVQAFVTATPADRAATGLLFGNSSSMTRADGTFDIAGLAPGTYDVLLRPRTMPDANAEFGQVRVTVGADDIDNVLIATSRGAIARGVITTDESTPPPLRPQQVRVFAAQVEPDLMVMGGEPRINEDWTFEITGLSQPRLFTANVAESPEWTLKAVLLNGQDITDKPLAFVPGQTVDGLQIVLTRKRTELSGGLTNDRGEPETDATVIVFAEDASRWSTPTRYIRTARPSQDGRFTMRVPPEDYFVIAVRNVEPGQWQDPEFLAGIRDQATRVSLGEGETKVQNLKVAKQ
jgi:hypothetical protein